MVSSSSRRRAVKEVVEEGLGSAPQACRALELARSSFYLASLASVCPLLGHIDICDEMSLIERPKVLKHAVARQRFQQRRKSHRWGSGTGRNSRFGTRSCLLFLVVPVNIYLTGAIENRISVPFAKIVPTPFHKGFYFRAGRGE